MSNDELQRAIDDITSGEKVTESAPESGAATVQLPEEMGGAAPDDAASSILSELPNLNMEENASESVNAAVDKAIEGVANETATLPEAPEGASAPQEPSMPILGVNEAPAASPEPTEGIPVMDSAPEAPKVPDLPEMTPPEVPAPEAPATEMPAVPEANEEKPVETEVTETAPEVPTPEVATEAAPEVPTSEVQAAPENAETGEFSDVKTQAMKELYPIIEKVQMEPKEKFQICIDVAKSGDKKALEKALEVAKTMPDEQMKAESLLTIFRF